MRSNGEVAVEDCGAHTTCEEEEDTLGGLEGLRVGEKEGKFLRGCALDFRGELLGVSGIIRLIDGGRNRMREEEEENTRNSASQVAVVRIRQL